MAFCVEQQGRQAARPFLLYLFMHVPARSVRHGCCGQNKKELNVIGVATVFCACDNHLEGNF